MSAIFLSHSSVDKPFARRLASALRQHGHHVWLDEAEIKIGDSLIEKIRTGIDMTDYVIALLSTASVASPWVKRELEIALNQEINGRTVKVLPVILDEVTVPSFLAEKKYADLRAKRLSKSALAPLLITLDDNRGDTQRRATSFWEFSYIQSSLDEPPYDLGAAPEGSAWLQLEIIDCDGEPKTHEIVDCISAPDMFGHLTEPLSVLTGRDAGGFRVGHAKTDIWSATDYHPWQHRHNYHIFNTSPQSRPYSGFSFDIRRHCCIFQPYRKGNCLSKGARKPTATLRDQIGDALTTMAEYFFANHPGDLIVSPIQATDELPEYGGFGYYIPLMAALDTMT